MNFEIYKDSAGEYRWRLKAGNGKVIADSGEGYVEKSDCVEAVWKIRSGVRLAGVTVDGEPCA